MAAGGEVLWPADGRSKHTVFQVKLARTNASDALTNLIVTWVVH